MDERCLVKASKNLILKVVGNLSLWAEAKFDTMPMHTQEAYLTQFSSKYASTAAGAAVWTSRAKVDAPKG
jgi:hypothetical protein